MPSPPADSPILSVNELNQFAKELLEMQLNKVWISGEVSNFSQPASGHWYFTLKDQQAQVRCAMFRNRHQLLRLNPKDGQQMLVLANVSLYKQRGDYQLIVDYMEESGIGALQRQFEQLKNLLQKKGYFDLEQKRLLPTYPQHIAIITSQTGAALQDILRVFKANAFNVCITLIPTLVQGKTAAKEIVKAINQAPQITTPIPVDTILLGRGGGSLEDLWPFNEQMVAEAIYAAEIPIISAVGHETDTTISDFAADIRAATPSIAAEQVSASQATLNQRLDDLENQLIDKFKLICLNKHKQLETLKSQLKKPQQQLQRQQEKLLHIKHQLNQSIKTQLRDHHNQLNYLISHLERQPLKIQHQQKVTKLNHQKTLLLKAITRLIEYKQQEFTHMSQGLNQVSPLATLDRGYSILTTQQSEVIKSTQQIAIKESINAEIQNGFLTDYREDQLQKKYCIKKQIKVLTILFIYTLYYKNISR